MSKLNYLVAGSKPWNRRTFENTISRFPGNWQFLFSKDELNLANIISFAPRYIFFLHWSHAVPVDLLEQFECVCFHMTDVPYGRGGSPLQNLIVRGHRSTKLTALRMVEAFDAGPVYFKADLSLEGSSAEEIYVRASELSARLIRRIIEEEPTPQPQVGEATVFKRRKPAESLIPTLPTLQTVYDFIRMLDAEGYPRAFIEHAGFRYEFDRATLYNGKVIANVTITPLEEIH